MNANRLHLSAPAWIPGLIGVLLLSGCTQPQGSQSGKGEAAPVYDETYLDPTGPSYMTGPTRVHYPDLSDVHLQDEEYAEFQSQLFGFMESNNKGEFERHFRDHYIPETFPHDSLLDLYVRMYFQWDSIGVTNRFDHWWVRYVSPFAMGAVYDVAIAEVRMRHHQVFQKRWTGNYRNFGRTFAQRYPGATIEYMDTTWVEDNGDTVLHRLISVETDRFIYLVRGHADSTHDDRIRLLPDGWQLSPEVFALMDSTAVATVEEHQRQFGKLEDRPKVSGR